jgi:hypothetical protein
MGYSGAWGKLIHEKNLRSKISWHCPFKNKYIVLLFNFFFSVIIILDLDLMNKNVSATLPKTPMKYNKNNVIVIDS